jgi:hypothetical protein
MFERQAALDNPILIELVEPAPAPAVPLQQPSVSMDKTHVINSHAV